METAAGDIERLPEELLVAVISLTLTSYRDACSVAAVSRTFRAAADSDAVWSRFLPGDLPEFDQAQLACTAQPSKKALFRRLTDRPALLPCRQICMQLDRVTGDKHYMLRRTERDISRHEDEDEDEKPKRCEWINLGCRDVGRNKRFESFQSAFWTS